MILVTGGCGFIGSAFVLNWLASRDEEVINLDLLTYAGHAGNLRDANPNPLYHFIQGDIGDRILMRRLLSEFKPRAVVHFAAETHVDRSISAPMTFALTNVVGTVKLLDAVLEYWRETDKSQAAAFRFLHVSTDEVFGSLEPQAAAFTELHRYEPNSPYSASKAASDHFVRSYHHTYGLPTLVTHCSNNYGPRQFPEKLIPLVIRNGLLEKHLPIYGDGQQIRDWLHVNDHCSALSSILDRGRPGENYNIGGRSEKTNLEAVKTICSVLDELRPLSGGRNHESLITHVTDRPGHDRRYAINDSKLTSELGWVPSIGFEQGIRETVCWYLKNAEWIESINNGNYRDWIVQNYSKREVIA